MRSRDVHYYNFLPHQEPKPGYTFHCHVCNVCNCSELGSTRRNGKTFETLYCSIRHGGCNQTIRFGLVKNAVRYATLELAREALPIAKDECP